MKNNVKYILLCGAVLVSCEKKPTDFRKFLDGQEITYPGALNDVTVLPGNYRLQLEWAPNPDPSITHYTVYWNNYADSLVVAAQSHTPTDTVKCTIDKLQEYNYTFFINAYDDAGNKSVTKEVDNARVYGDIYHANLFNRPVNADTPFIVSDDPSSVQIKFSTPDTSNVNTVVTYTNLTGTVVTKNVPPDSSSLQLVDYQFGTPVRYQSSYIPQKRAIDTFFTAKADTFPTIYQLVECDKAKFAEVNFPFDVGIYESDTYKGRLWDGNATVRSYPNIFHSDDPGGSAGTMPRSLSFDMGAVYDNIAVMEEIGRDCCNNPGDFEIWGIADTTGATPSLPSNDPNWKSMITAKGWTLLTEAVRTDDGVAPKKFTFAAHPPQVRYVIIRVLKDVNGANAINMSQLTLWYKKQ
ncbi:protein of unknown function [Chitinophaga costaii]|uniref:DUF5000 domain-containing protein n=1 Tax=Chitinophaga costaii TaxID=1335309 RepID=A0A1C4FLH1_9BACT|nr:DUF4998 domain-containing protein [Chitinophaga costaii]PUZ29998.1 hypothetical protein DCM91_00515 [Chitinophaga costaii]SCC56331.1 protein of unknown function [Chitinophaga costaii]